MHCIAGSCVIGKSNSNSNSGSNTNSECNNHNIFDCWCKQRRVQSQQDRIFVLSRKCRQQPQMEQMRGWKIILHTGKYTYIVLCCSLLSTCICISSRIYVCICVYDFGSISSDSLCLPRLLYLKLGHEIFSAPHFRECFCKHTYTHIYIYI